MRVGSNRRAFGSEQRGVKRPSLINLSLTSFLVSVLFLLLTSGYSRATRCGSPFEYVTSRAGGELTVIAANPGWEETLQDGDQIINLRRGPYTRGGLIRPLWQRSGVFMVVHSFDYRTSVSLASPRDVSALAQTNPGLVPVCDELVTHLLSSPEGELFLDGASLRFGTWRPHLAGWLAHVSALGFAAPTLWWATLGVLATRRKLQTARTRRWQRHGPACTHCGYSFDGLQTTTAPTCPECGQSAQSAVD